MSNWGWLTAALVGCLIGSLTAYIVMLERTLRKLERGIVLCGEGIDQLKVDYLNLRSQVEAEGVQDLVYVVDVDTTRVKNAFAQSGIAVQRVVKAQQIKAEADAC